MKKIIAGLFLFLLILPAFIIPETNDIQEVEHDEEKTFDRQDRQARTNPTVEADSERTTETALHPRNVSSISHHRAADTEKSVQTMNVNQQEVDTTQWHEGETVRVDIIPSNVTAVETSRYFDPDASIAIVTQGSFERTYFLDGELYNVTNQNTENIFTNDLYVEFSIYSVYMNGILSIKAGVNATDSGFGTQAIVTPTLRTFMVNSSYFLPTKELRFRLRASATGLMLPARYVAYYYLYVYNPFADRWDQFHADSTTVSVSSYTSSGFLSLLIDYVMFTPGVVEMNAKSMYRYTSSTTLMHEISIEIFAVNSRIVIYKPVDWTYSSVTPLASVTTSGNDIVITGTVDTTYTITFTSSQNRHLAISDVSNTYLRNVGFENGWQDDWFTTTLDSVSQNTSVVFEGAFSLRLSDTSADTDSLNFDYVTGDIPAGYYYISFNYYVESFSGTKFTFTHYNAGWIDHVLDVSTTDRWQEFFAFVHVVPDGQGRDFYFAFYSGSGTVFIDNFRIYKVNTQISTTGVNEYQIQATLRSWDGRLDPTLPSTSATMLLVNRTKTMIDPRIIASKQLTSDENGVVTWNLDMVLYQQEYEIVTIAKDDRFWQFSENFDGETISNLESEGWVFQEYADGDWYISSNRLYYDDTQNLAKFATALVPKTFVTDGEISVRGIVGNQYHRFGLAVRVQEADDYIAWKTRWNRGYFITLRGNAGGTSGNLTVERIDAEDGTRTIIAFYDPGSIGISTEYEIKVVLDGSTIDVYFQGSKVISVSDNTYDAGYVGVMSSEYANYVDDFKLNATWGASAYFTPISAQYRDFATSEGDWGSDGWDFSEEASDDWTIHGSSTNLIFENGYARFDSNGDGTTRPGVAITFSADAVGYAKFIVRLKANASGSLTLQFYDNGAVQQTVRYVAVSTSYAVQEVTITVNFDNIRFYYEVAKNDVPRRTWIDFIRIVKVNTPVLSETSNSFILSSQNDSFVYSLYQDNVSWGEWQDLEIIPKIVEAGWHNLTYIPIYDLLRPTTAFLHDVAYQYSYYVSEDGIMKIIIHDQSGNALNFDSFKVYVNGTRLYDQYVYFTDTAASFNLTITDLFDNQLYTNASETFEQFKEIALTLYSLKVQNIQENPIWFRIQRGGKYYSEWIFSYEVIEYRLEAANYTIWVYYSDVAGNFSVATNGTYVSYTYEVTSDTAIRVTGKTIEDVFNNVISLSQDLQNVNASLTNQIISVNITVGNVNTSITNQVVSVDIHLDNVNTTITQQLLDLDAAISNLETNITIQLSDINQSLLNVNSTLYSQTVSILSDLSNVNSTLFSQTLSILSDISNVNSTLYNQTVDILSKVANTNSTLYSQTLSILSDLQNVNSTLYSQTVSILSDISNVNSTLYSQTISILSDIQNTNSTLYSQTLTILSDIQNVNTTLYGQTVNILSRIQNVNSTLYNQTVEILSNLSNVNSTLYAQTISILSDVQNVNATLYSQTISILSNIQNVNTTLYSQTLTILSNIENVNSTLYSQTLSILSDLQNVNSTLYAQTVSILSDISNVNSTLFNQTVSILNELSLVNSSIMTSVLEIGTNITLLESEMKSNFTNIETIIGGVNSTLYSQTVSILTAIAEIQGIYRVHFDITDSLGIGLPWETFFVYVNGSRIYKQDQVYSNATPVFLIVEAKDAFNVTVFRQNFTVTSHRDIIIRVELYWVIFRNEGNYTAYVEIYRNDVLGMNVTVSPGSDIAVRMTGGDYEYRLYYYEKEAQNDSSGVMLGDVADFGKKLFKIDRFRVSTALPRVVDVSTPVISAAKEIVEAADGFRAFVNGFLTAISWGAIGMAVASAMLYVAIKEGWIMIKVLGFKRAPEDSLIKPDWIEAEEDRLNYEMMRQPKKYQKKKRRKAFLGWW